MATTYKARLKAALIAAEVPDLDFWMERHPEVIATLIKQIVIQAKKSRPERDDAVDAIQEALKTHEPEFYASLAEEFENA